MYTGCLNRYDAVVILLKCIPLQKADFAAYDSDRANMGGGYLRKN